MTRHKRILIAGAALVLGGNAFALIGVAYNRSGAPDAQVELSERELVSPPRYAIHERENSGLALQIAWRLDYGPQHTYSGHVRHRSGAPWLDRDKLKSLGFKLAAAPELETVITRRADNVLPREAYIVLEFDGAAYRAAVEVARAELATAQAIAEEDPELKENTNHLVGALRRLDREEHESSRLFAVDAGSDMEALRARYRDRAHYIILPGEVRLGVSDEDYIGYPTLTLSHIHVPLEYRDVVVREEQGREPKYRVQLAVGKRAEPWIVDAQPAVAD
jgi:hypothetical protein